MPPMSRNFVFISILIYLIVILASCFSLIQHNFKTTAKNKDLENKILANQLRFKEQELLYLKKQIHPHFLFNTLNTIYGFALKKSEFTPDIILKLSNLLDYILYQVQKPKVSLEEEISHIKEYIDLEQIRFQDTLDISFNSDKIPPELQIAPMMFLPFVENAFKHGSIINGIMQVEMNLNFENEHIIFSIKNTSIHEVDLENTKGLGLENIRKRLALNYEGNYELSTLQRDNWYEVDLRIPQKIKDAEND
jgi:two-component system LytT family sensor kinase